MSSSGTSIIHGSTHLTLGRSDSLDRVRLLSLFSPQLSIVSVAQSYLPAHAPSVSIAPRVTCISSCTYSQSPVPLFPLPIITMQRPKQLSWTKSDPDQPLILDPQYIRARTRWIRDDLDPQLARDGPDILSPDIVITLFTFLEELRRSTPSLETLRSSRVHLALLDMTGCATRWPGKLINKADHLIKHLEASYGALADIRPFLYEEGGRLYGICTPEDVERDKLLIKWLRDPNVLVSPALSRRHGDLGFTPGECVLFFPTPS